MLPREYTREALKRGLAYEQSLGVNPFKFGLIGSTDSHTGLSTAQENNFFGKVALLEPTADPIRFDEVIVGRFPEGRDPKTQIDRRGKPAPPASRPSGRARIRVRRSGTRWRARRCTRRRARASSCACSAATTSRPAISTSAISRRTATRRASRWAAILKAAPAGKAPVFLVRALRDVDGANLDRIQMIKGWLDAAGQTHEQVYDLAWSGNRKPGHDGKLPPVGNTVNVKEASYTNASARRS